MGKFFVVCLLGVALLQTACTGDGFSVKLGSQGTMSLGSSTDDTKSGAQLNSDYQEKALQILQANCTSCHFATTGPSNVYGFGDVNHLVSSGLIIPGNAPNSKLYIQVSNSLMPPGAPLSAADVAVLSNWIAGPAATPTPTPTPTPNTTAATYTTLKQNILQPKCVTCHAAFATYDGFKAEVVAGDPANSIAFDKVNRGEMPKGGPFLSVDEVRMIYDWIAAGAQNN